MADEYLRLKGEVDKYLTRIKSGKSTGGDEHDYSSAYQNLVRAGYAMQIKKKYR